MNRALIIKSIPLDVYEQMSLDEVICETMPEKYILRFFNWKEKGITFGFSQRYSNVINTLEPSYRDFKMTRRPTGGGIVIHESDITFSFIFYSPEMFNPNATYEKLHSLIKNEYESNGISIDIANGIKSNYDINTPTMDCFKKPVEKDLLVGGKKVLGGALRKFSDYLLYQASLQISGARENMDFHSKVIINSFEKGFDLKFEDYIINEEFYKKISDKKNEKYISEHWIKRI